ncbi:hypothetical protein V7S43_015141 [Phytophthora oleae]|uniref:Uncharacterized protein n=1 Tax=Phytophthora oleae TaxID=2107226 RepID=A0ABD3F401_9STRA
MAPSPAGPSVQTTCARSIVTVDGYVSRGRYPPSSVPRDHAMLQEFAVYLELRLKCLNMSMLRRIFADFLNEQENTLVPMLQMGFTIVTIYPVLRTSPQRLEKAKILLHKPKSHLDMRGCVFLYLQYRTATRNMALLKQLFLEFVEHRESSLLTFVERGFEVISVIPFELSQLAPPVSPQSPQVQQESPRAVEAVQEQSQLVEEPVAKNDKKKTTARAPEKPVTTRQSPTASSSALVASPDENVQAVEKGLRRRAKRVSPTGNSTESVTTEAPAASNEPPAVSARRKSVRKAVSSGEPATNEASQTGVLPASSSAVVSAPRRGRKPKVSTLPAQEAASAPEPVEFGSPEDSTPVAEPPTRKRGRKPHKPESGEVTEAKPKRGKPVKSEETIQSQLKLTRRVQVFEEQLPWEVVYSNLPAPFDEAKYAALSLKFRKFWRNHARAVWERKFWAVMSRKLNRDDFNARNNRQLAAKNAFESLIVAVYGEFGAQFFIELDREQHPGWWYRGPVVSLFALQQMKGEQVMWDYVKKDALKRFPDCQLPLPLAASNSGAMRVRHERESELMWMANHQLTNSILVEVSALKEEQRVRRGQQAVS